MIVKFNKIYILYNYYMNVIYDIWFYDMIWFDMIFMWVISYESYDMSCLCLSMSLSYRSCIINYQIIISYFSSIIYHRSFKLDSTHFINTITSMTPTYSHIDISWNVQLTCSCRKVAFAEGLRHLLQQATRIVVLVSQRQVYHWLHIEFKGVWDTRRWGAKILAGWTHFLSHILLA